MAAMAMVSKQLNKPCIIVVNDKKSNVGKVCNDLKGLLGSFDIDVHWMGAAASWDALSQSQLLQRSFATGGVVPVLQCYYTELTRLNTYVREQGIVGKDMFALLLVYKHAEVCYMRHVLPQCKAGGAYAACMQ